MIHTTMSENSDFDRISKQFTTHIVKSAKCTLVEGVYKNKVLEQYKSLDFSGDFFIFIESKLGSGIGDVSEPISDVKAKKAILLLLMAEDILYDFQSGIEDWNGKDCVFFDIVANKQHLKEPFGHTFSQSKYDFLHYSMVLLVQKHVHSLKNKKYYELFKRTKSLEKNTIDNIEVTIPLSINLAKEGKK